MPLEDLSLGETELKMLRLMMAHPNRVFDRTQLLDRIWGDHVFIEERTVDVHIRRLRIALGPQGRDMVVAVRGSGYKLAVPEPVGADGDATPLSVPAVASPH